MNQLPVNSHGGKQKGSREGRSRTITFEFSEVETSSTLSLFKYQKPMIARSKTGNHIGGSFPHFMREFGKGDLLPSVSLENLLLTTFLKSYNI